MPDRGIQKQRTQAARKTAKRRPTFTGKARPKYMTGLNVFDAAKERMKWLFEDFDGNITVSNSGGKDSTVILEMAVMVAKELGTGPVRVQWLDQECEFQATVDYQRYIWSRHDEIDFHWYQIPFRIFNATNHDNPWLNAWGPGEEWVRDKEPYSIHDNTFGADRFTLLLSEINQQWPGQAVLTGMRAEESPARRLILTSGAMYKWATWCSVDGPADDPYFRFHPIYDWSYRDVWKAIHDNGWHYNDHYNTQFQYGVPVKNMRVSNYHHETAMGALQYLQEAEPETWEAATRRLAGISTYGHVGKDQMPKTLPYMFSGWVEYMHHLNDNLVPEEYQGAFMTMHDNIHSAIPSVPNEVAARVIAKAIIGNDIYGTTIDMWKITNNNPKKVAEWTKQGKEAFTA